MPYLEPGATLGVVGGGQLGLYFVHAARRHGYRTCVLDPDLQSPAGTAAHDHLVAQYDDPQALERLGEICDAVTLEFENVPALSLERLAERCRVVPSADSVRVAQDRMLEKGAASAAGLMPVPHARILPGQALDEAVRITGLPAILKTVRLGYDGVGQRACASLAELEEARSELGPVALVLERRIDLAAELSVVLVRSDDGECQFFPAARNEHVNGILARSTVPSGLDPELEQTAQAQAATLAESLDYRGVLAVEFFVDGDGNLWFNEMAPRPHNSGHYTLDATDVSQFDQQLRALCHLPLAQPQLHSAVCMLNLLGDRWDGSSPRFDRMLGLDGVLLHLYGKREARAGRKMGHVNCIATTPAQAIRLADDADRQLK